MEVPIFDQMAGLKSDGLNPYPDDTTYVLKDKLEHFRDEHPNEFLFIDDWKDVIHSYYIYELQPNAIESIHGKKFNEKLKVSDVPELDRHIKDFFILNKDISISKDLKSWADRVVYEEKTGGENARNADEFVEQPEIEVDTDVDFDGDIEEEIQEDSNNESVSIPVQSEVTYDTEILSDLAMYDYTSNSTITYEELAKLCLNQAKKELTTIKIRNMENEKIQLQKRDELTRSIRKYLDLNEISQHFSDRITQLDKLTIADLEILHKQCEDKFDMLKTKDMLKNLLITAEVGYNSLFPNGIPFGKNKYINIDPDVINEIQSALFDVRSVPGNAFRRILDKHHIKLPDEVTVSIELLKIILKGTSITRTDNEEEMEEEIEEENSEGEEEEIEELSD